MTSHAPALALADLLLGILCVLSLIAFAIVSVAMLCLLWDGLRDMRAEWRARRKVMPRR